MKDYTLSTAKIEIRYIVNTPNIIHYGIIENTIIIISVCDTRRSPVSTHCMALAPSFLASYLCAHNLNIFNYEHE